MRRLVVLIIVLILVLGGISVAEKYVPQLIQSSQQAISQQPVKVVSEESVTISDVKQVGPSVVTILENVPQDQGQSFDMGPFGMFGLSPQDNSQSQPQSIGSGFIVAADGLIVTNKHVVSDTNGTYQVITASDKKYDVKKIYRDPLNDIAIIKIDPSQNLGESLKPVPLGNSSNLQVGQFVVAIGTALGEFRNTVTTGVISGLGRGIQAGDEFQGYVEQLDNVIQTSAPINPGNSGGPLVDSQGTVIGVNTAVAQNGQNIGFALPINVIKDSLNNFNQTGQFNRPYLGVAYKFIPKQEAILNDIVAGAYVQSVVKDSPAQQAGIKDGDVIVKVDGQTVNDKNNSLAALIARKKVGDQITITAWRDGNTQDLHATLASAPNQ
jgi:serine protease Do